jgi:hypothetical protein
MPSQSQEVGRLLVARPVGLGNVWDSETSGVEPFELSVFGTTTQVESPFVQQSVVERADESQVMQRGLPTVGPVPDMVTVDETLVRAAWKLTPAVARPQCAPYRGRNGSALSADI